MDSRYAQKIINVAKGEVGKVTDSQPVYEGGKMTELRFGWENLKKYFEVAGGYTDTHWKQKGMFKGEEITHLDGVKIKNKRVPQKNKDNAGNITWTGTQWCGIFATWVWMTAGIPNVSWGFPGVKGPKVRIVPDFTTFKKDLTISDVGLGDIVILKDDDPNNKLVHHCIVTRLMGEDFECVNGNSDYQGILIKTLSRRRINGFYTIKDDILTIIKDLYG